MMMQQNQPRLRLGIILLDIITVLILLFAVFLMVRPGSVFYEAMHRRLTARTTRQSIERNWRLFASTAIPLYASDADPDVIEFLDYECPFCRSVSPSVDSAIQSGARIAIVHLPLAIHARAKWAALAAICSAADGHFKELHRELLARSEWRTDSSSATAWPHAAKPEKAVRECIAHSSSDSVLRRHLALADTLRLTGTPTFISRRGILRGAPTAGGLALFAKEP